MAAREFEVVIENYLGPLTRAGMHLDHGEWSNDGAQAPPEHIPGFQMGPRLEDPSLVSDGGAANPMDLRQALRVTVITQLTATGPTCTSTGTTPSVEVIVSTSVDPIGWTLNGMNPVQTMQASDSGSVNDSYRDWGPGLLVLGPNQIEGQRGQPSAWRRRPVYSSIHVNRNE